MGFFFASFLSRDRRWMVNRREKRDKIEITRYERERCSHVEEGEDSSAENF